MGKSVLKLHYYDMTRHNPLRHKKLTCTLQIHSAAGELGRALIDNVLAHTRRQGGIELLALAGKPEDKPNILPHNVHFVSPEAAVKDLTTDIFILTGGPLAAQYTLASEAITNGKHVVIADNRLLAAYGDILPKMAAAYGVQFGVSSVFSSQPQALMYLENLRPFGVKEVTWISENMCNTYLSAQELSHYDIEVPEEAHQDFKYQQKMHEYQNLALGGRTFNNWKKTTTQSGAMPALPTAHDVRVAQRMGGCLRYVSCVTSHNSATGIHLLPLDHALVKQKTGVTITLETGAQHMLAATDNAENAVQEQAMSLLSDIIQITQNPRRSVNTGDSYKSQAPQNNVMLFTNTACWRENETDLKADVIAESLVGTTLTITLRPRGEIMQTLAAAQTLGSAFLMTEARLNQQVPALRLAI